MTHSARRSVDAFVLARWSITAPTNTIYAGNVHVTASDDGHEIQEFVIVRAQRRRAADQDRR